MTGEVEIRGTNFDFWGAADAFTFSLDHKFNVPSIGEEFLAYLDSNSLEIEVWAAPSSQSQANTNEQVANGDSSNSTDEFKLLVTMSIQELEGKEYKVRPC